MTKCDRGRGVKIGQNSVTYFMDCHLYLSSSVFVESFSSLEHISLQRHRILHWVVALDISIITIIKAIMIILTTTAAKCLSYLSKVKYSDKYIQEILFASP